MPLPAPATTQSRQHQRTRITPATAGLPDPRPVTDYSVAWEMVGAVLKLTITLDQPCVIRSPEWMLVDVRDGVTYHAASVSVLSTTSFTMDFEPGVPETCGFISVPYQDMQVQNFQGGFVAPGAKWFRGPE